MPHASNVTWRCPGGAWGCVCLCFVLGLGWASPSHAQPVLSGSMGFGFEFHPLQARQATNIMVTPGYGLLGDLVRPELGIVGTYGAQRGGLKDRFALELRPMLRLGLPLLPLYFRAILAGLQLSSSQPGLAYGGALGVNLQLLKLGLFAEFGVLPRYLDARMHWIGEARLGASYAI